MMSKYERRWIRRHPLEWIKSSWFHWTIGISLCVKAWIITNPVFDPVFGFEVWPIIIAAVGGMCILSSVVPLSERAQAFVASVLFGLSISRILAFLQIVYFTDLNDSGKIIAGTFAVHWGVVALIAMHWPNMSRNTIGKTMVIESGRDDRGDNRHPH